MHKNSGRRGEDWPSRRDGGWPASALLKLLYQAPPLPKLAASSGLLRLYKRQPDVMSPRDTPRTWATSP
jgi:hypothetical protein